jgi:DNA-directed RNA polymerase specialized sigma24 family protein
MDKTPPPGADEASRLDAISTQSSLLEQAHRGPASAAMPARNALVMRYRKAIRGYLGALLQNDGDADELAQEVVVKMLQGGFAGFRSERGRFRDYLKAAVRNAALCHFRRRGTSAHVELDAEGLADSAGPDPRSDETWLADWRRSLLEGARQALHAFQAGRPGNVYATLLDLLRDHPEDDREALAGRLAERTGQRLRADAVRKQISRARRKFAELLLEEVRRTLDDPTPERVFDELIDVGLLPFVRDYLPPDWVRRSGTRTDSGGGEGPG